MSHYSQRLQELSKENRLLLPGACIILVLFSVLTFRSGYSAHLLLNEEIKTKAELYGLSTQMLSESENISKQLVAAKRRVVELEEGLFKVTKPSLGAAKLQSVLQEMASKRGMMISSAKTLPFKVEGIYTVMPVEFRLKINPIQLKELLYDIQSASVLIGVKETRIKVSDIRKPDDLDVTLIVEGLIKDDRSIVSRK